ncbi:hypothetical protein D3C77_554030 [compost metagenome]
MVISFSVFLNQRLGKYVKSNVVVSPSEDLFVNTHLSVFGLSDLTMEELIAIKHSFFAFGISHTLFLVFPNRDGRISRLNL